MADADKRCGERRLHLQVEDALHPSQERALLAAESLRVELERVEGRTGGGGRRVDGEVGGGEGGGRARLVEGMRGR
jgi:hypothetical protein